MRFLAALRTNRYTLAQDISVEVLLTRHHQSEKLRRVLWRPLCVAALNTPPDRASAQVFLNVLRDSLDATRAASDLVLARVDLSALFPDPAATYVEQHGGTVLRAQRVTAIDPLAERVRDRSQRSAHALSAMSSAPSPRIRSTHS